MRTLPAPRSWGRESYIEDKSMVQTMKWHSSLATARPLYHNDTRCCEGDAIAVKDRRSGDGGRDPCPYCAELLFEDITSNVLGKRDRSRVPAAAQRAIR